MSDAPPKAKIFVRDDGLFAVGVLMPFRLHKDSDKFTIGKGLEEGGQPIYCMLADDPDNPLAGCFTSREAAQAAIDKALSDA